jgi:prepilin-type N-terminal cleavage/methylation domain-containing protein
MCYDDSATHIVSNWRQEAPMNPDPQTSGSGKPTPSTRTRFLQAFTLIEVLVVVAIIALLITILLPALKRAREQAKITACLANLHDLGTAHHQYAHSNKDWFVPTPYIGSTINQGPNSDDNIFTLWYKRYARTPDSFTCPGTTHRLRVPERVETYLDASSGLIWYRLFTAGVQRNDFEYLAQRQSSGGFGTSYEYNLWIDDSRPGARASTRINWHPSWVNRSPHDQVMKKPTMTKPHPAFAILMHDADDGADDGDIIGSSRVAFNNYPEPWDNHGIAAMNILFVDMHTESVRRWDLTGGGGRIWDRQNRTR